MKTKEKNKNIRNTFIIIIFIIISIILFVMYYIFSNKGIIKVSNEDIDHNFTISKAKLVDVNKLIQINTKNTTREEIVVEETELEYITKYQNNKDLPKGTIQVVQEGRSGLQKIYTRKTYYNNELIKEEQINSTITKSAVDKIVEIGIANYTSNYKIKLGDKLYVTSDRLSIKLDNSVESEKIGTILKDTEVKLLQIEENMYKISANGIIGWVAQDSLTYINPNYSGQDIEKNYGGITKSQALAKLSFNMNLNTPSGFTLEQFKKVLTDSKDKNSVFSNNAEYFYYIEKQYNVNGVFIASVGIHESNWGTSKIANNKKNLFGYGAYDSNPYNGAYTFSNYSESIDLIARVFVKYYLNPAGTKIYNGEIASGKYYSGSTLSGINKRYATDKNWANGVYTHMKYLYNKL